MVQRIEGRRSEVKRLIEAQEESEVSEAEELVKQLEEEIEDRKQFLEEMTSVGMGHHYQNVINTEISQVTQLNLSD